MIISLLITAPTIVLFTLSQSFIQVLFAALLLVAAGIYFAPAYEALQADLTPKAMRGRITALWDISNAVSAALGALVGGFMFQTVSPASPFYFFAVAELGAALLLIKVVREPETKEA
jgi:predicted MFS family arabinose efflux permease